MKRREIFGEGKYLVRDGGEIWRWNRRTILGKVNYFFAEKRYNEKETEGNVVRRKILGEHRRRKTEKETEKIFRGRKMSLWQTDTQTLL